MPEYFKEFEIRWSELDPNNHVANYAYTQFMNEVRISYFLNRGIERNFMEEVNMGPVVFHEHFHYIKEITAYEKVIVDVQMKGHSEDFKFLNLAHHLYNIGGEIAMFSEITFGWLDLSARKLVIPHEEYIKGYKQMKKTDDFRIILPGETRVSGIPYKKKLETVL